jgi:hypothetical protein
MLSPPYVTSIPCLHLHGHHQVDIFMQLLQCTILLVYRYEPNACVEPDVLHAVFLCGSGGR